MQVIDNITLVLHTNRILIHVRNKYWCDICISGQTSLANQENMCCIQKML